MSADGVDRNWPDDGRNDAIDPFRTLLLAEDRPTCFDTLGRDRWLWRLLDRRTSGTAISGCVGGGYRRL